MKGLAIAAALSAPYWVIFYLWPWQTAYITLGAGLVLVAMILTPPPEPLEPDPQFDKSAEETMRMLGDRGPQ